MYYSFYSPGITVIQQKVVDGRDRGNQFSDIYPQKRKVLIRETAICMVHIWKIVQCLYLVGGFLPAFKKRMRNKNLLCDMKSQKREK